MSTLTEIVATGAECIRRLEAWIGDKNANAILPESVALGIEVFYLKIREGDVPRELQDLAVATGKLYAELTAYSEHKARSAQPNGAPTEKFWVAAREVAKCLEASRPLPPEVLEPVIELRRQGVSPEQIARQIYGRGGVGPFLLENGAINYKLLEEEATKPGSVIGPDWIPPWHAEVQRRHAESVRNRLSAYDTLATPKKVEDPHTVEEMILEGAYVQQIERAKGVTRDEVLEVAARLGVTVEDQPGFRVAPTARPVPIERAPETGTTETAEATAETATAETATAETATEKSAKAPAMTPDQETAAKALTIDLWKANENIGFAELAQAVRDKGYPVNVQRCAGWITHFRRGRDNAA